jgi:outer membrane protein assembly factor BamB
MMSDIHSSIIIPSSNIQFFDQINPVRIPSPSSLACWLCLATFSQALLCWTAASAALPESPASSMRYAPPEATLTGNNQLQLFAGEIDQKQFAAAATRLDILLRDSADALMGQGDDSSVLSISAWEENLPPQTKALLRPASEAALGDVARQAVQAAQAKPDTDPAEFYEIAQRYPLTQAASAGLAEAARRSALMGDVPAARWMLDAATAGGWLPDPSLQNQINRTLAPPSAFAGPLPFNATWYGGRTRQAWAALRSFPVAAGNVLFVVGPAQVIAMKGNGQILWKGPTGVAPSPGRGASASMGVTRGPPFTAAVLSDAAGAPQILVVRQPQLHADGWALRALRASDGRLLWTTEGQDDYHGLIFGSNPVIQGRYVYAIAGETTDQLDHLWLIATEVTTGQLLWRCDIGSISRTIAPQPGSRLRTDVYRPWLNESAPVVAGDLVVATPNVGAVIAVGRFDGKLRWTRGYPALADPTVHLRQQRLFAIEHPDSIPALPSGLSLRWASAPAVDGDTVIAAPQDSDQTLAVGLHDGKPLWKSPDLSEATLVGTSNGVALMAGATLTALTPANAKVVWKFADPPIVGPSILHAGAVLVPTAAGVISLSAETGLPIQSADSTPLVETAISSESAHQALTANDVGHCFGINGARAGSAR